MVEAVQVIKDHADRLFVWDYERDRGQLVTLYNKAMGSQWNSVTDLDWATEVRYCAITAHCDDRATTAYFQQQLAPFHPTVLGQLAIALADQAAVRQPGA